MPSPSGKIWSEIDYSLCLFSVSIVKVNGLAGLLYLLNGGCIAKGKDVLCALDQQMPVHFQGSPARYAVLSPADTHCYHQPTWCCQLEYYFQGVQVVYRPEICRP